MTKIIAKELKGKTDNELVELLEKERKERINLRFQVKLSTIKDTSTVTKNRKNIARVKTEINLRKLIDGKTSK